MSQVPEKLTLIPYESRAGGVRNTVAIEIQDVSKNPVALPPDIRSTNSTGWPSEVRDFASADARTGMVADMRQSICISSRCPHSRTRQGGTCCLSTNGRGELITLHGPHQAPGYFPQGCRLFSRTSWQLQGSVHIDVPAAYIRLLPASDRPLVMPE